MVKCIIGKNSKLIRNLTLPQSWALISHKNIESFDFEKFEEVIVFSWNKKKQSDNINLLLKLPLYKTTFVSSTAIFSSYIRAQWNAYPIYKQKCEKIVLEGKGKIVRLGDVRKDMYPDVSGTFPITTFQILEQYLKTDFNKKSEVENLFTIFTNPKISLIQSFFKLFHKLSFLFPSKIIFQLPFEIIPKILNVKSYGYSMDSRNTLCNIIQIGGGVMGGLFQKNITKDNKFKAGLIIDGIKNDFSLNDNGFNGTAVGIGKKGLAKYWHGVFIKNNKNYWIKKVPIIPYRGLKNIFTKFKTRYVGLHVNNVKINNYNIEIAGIDKFNKSKKLYSNKLVLAAGWYTNSILLAKLLNINQMYLDDHEVCKIGTISHKDCISIKAISCFGPFIKRKCVFPNKDRSVLFEIRPKDKLNDGNLSLFNNIKKNIYSQIFNTFSLSKLNELIFNKFGIAFKVSEYNIYAQITVRNAISISFDDKFHVRRKREPIQRWIDVKKEFQKTTNIYGNISDSVDANHVVFSKKTSNLINKKLQKNKTNIIVIGCSEKYFLNCFHHTNKLVDLALNL